LLGGFILSFALDFLHTLISNVTPEYVCFKPCLNYRNPRTTHCRVGRTLLAYGGFTRSYRTDQRGRFLYPTSGLITNSRLELCFLSNTQSGKMFRSRTVVQTGLALLNTQEGLNNHYFKPTTSFRSKNSRLPLGFYQCRILRLG
jgi:hypothetical protein